jgi:hypothetical protein
MASLKSRSIRSKKHRVVENQVEFSELIEGKIYNVTEKTIVKRVRRPDEIKIITYTGEYHAQFQKAIRFLNVTIDGVTETERTVFKKDIIHITRFEFPGLPNDLRNRINSFSRPSPKTNKTNKTGYKPFNNFIKLSPGDEIIFKDGSHTILTHSTVIGPKGSYKTKPVNLHKKTRARNRSR